MQCERNRQSVFAFLVILDVDQSTFEFDFGTNENKAIDIQYFIAENWTEEQVS